ncbi:MAG TPA: efflux RND transporter permease subunit, partial [Candidatus Elarobacter sp.]
VLPGGTFTTPLAQRGVGIRSGAATAAQLAALPVLIPGTGAAPPVGELAEVGDGFADPVELVQVDGAPAIVVVVTGARSSDATRTIAALRRTVARLASTAALVRIEELRTAAPFANAAVNGVLQTLGEGVVLTVAVILVFLRRWRVSLVAAIAIPASLAAAFAAMWAAGFTLDVLSLMGLSLTVGILVDDSIVIVEAIARAVRRGERGDAAALSGRRELGGVAVAITAVDVAVFAPIAFMPGLIGAFMREFGLVVVFATAFSLLVSFTLAPLLAARWAVRDGDVPREGTHRELRDALARDAERLPWTLRGTVLLDGAAAWQTALAAFARLERALARGYAQRWLPAAWRYRGLVLAGAALVCALALVPVANGTIPTEFSPPVARGEVAVDLTFPPGTTLAHTGAGAARIAARLLDDPAVLHVVSSAGRAFNGTTDVVAPNLARVDAILADPSGGGAAVRREIDALAALVPDASIAGAGTGMGGLPPIGYALAGPPAAVDDAARRIARRLAADPNASDVRISSGGLAPRLEITVDSGRAQLLGVVPDDAALGARIATGGALATRLRLGGGLIDVVVREPSAQRGDLGALQQVEVRAGNGDRVPLASIAAFDDRPQPALVERENRERIVTVSANTRDGVPIGTVTAPLRAALRAPGFLPPGVRLVARGDLEQFLDAVAAIGAALGLGVVAVYATLVLLYRSWRLPLVIMLTVPLASAGAFGTLALLNLLRLELPNAALLQGQTLNLYSMLGIVMLVGLV